MNKSVMITLLTLLMLTSFVSCVASKNKTDRKDSSLLESEIENKVSESKAKETEIEKEIFKNDIRIENEVKDTKKGNTVFEKQLLDTESTTRKAKADLEKTEKITSYNSMQRVTTQAPITKATTKIKATTTAGNKNLTTKGTTTQIQNRETQATNTAASPTRKTSSATTHIHDYKAIYKTVSIPERGHFETVVVTPAWTEEKPIIERVTYIYFFVDGFKAYTQSGAIAHEDYLMENNLSTQWRTMYEYVQTGTEKINHKAVTEQIWIIDTPASTRQEVDYYRCFCGATR
ncbi:MAG: hypothetical protein GX326_03605 [Clostridiaceae bacterium]|nr:hypothetical protein [Clostridiaceae bacterium]